MLPLDEDEPVELLEDELELLPSQPPVLLEDELEPSLPSQPTKASKNSRPRK
jgi:hypothetical protein